jgi:hypothetical protein
MPFLIWKGKQINGTVLVQTIPVDQILSQPLFLLPMHGPGLIQSPMPGSLWLGGGGGDPGEATTRSYLVSFAGWSKGNIAEREVDTPETPDSSDPVPVWALRFVQISSGNHADAYIL